MIAVCPYLISSQTPQVTTRCAAGSWLTERSALTMRKWIYKYALWIPTIWCLAIDRFYPISVDRYITLGSYITLKWANEPRREREKLQKSFMIATQFSAIPLSFNTQMLTWFMFQCSISRAIYVERRRIVFDQYLVKYFLPEKYRSECELPKIFHTCRAAHAEKLRFPVNCKRWWVSLAIATTTIFNCNESFPRKWSRFSTHFFHFSLFLGSQLIACGSKCSVKPFIHFDCEMKADEMLWSKLINVYHYQLSYLCRVSSCLTRTVDGVTVHGVHTSWSMRSRDQRLTFIQLPIVVCLNVRRESPKSTICLPKLSDSVELCRNFDIVANRNDNWTFRRHSIATTLEFKFWIKDPSNQNTVFSSHSNIAHHESIMIFAFFRLIYNAENGFKVGNTTATFASTAK